eukprot:SAG31_NODE_3742_length_3930_cov_25.606108_1_plen_451_part_00
MVVNKAEMLTCAADRADAEVAMQSMLRTCGLEGLAHGRLHFVSARQAARKIEGVTVTRTNDGENYAAGDHGDGKWSAAMISMLAAIRESLESAVRRRASRLAELVDTLEQPLESVRRKVEFWSSLRQPGSTRAQRCAMHVALFSQQLFYVQIICAYSCACLLLVSRLMHVHVLFVVRIIGLLYAEAINGNKLVSSAKDHAEQARRSTSERQSGQHEQFNESCAGAGGVDAAVDQLVAWDTRAAVARGAVAGVGGFATLLVSVPAAVASSWLLCLRLVFAVAYLGGHDIYSPDVCNRAFACVTGSNSTQTDSNPRTVAAPAGSTMTSTTGMSGTVAVVGQVVEAGAASIATVAAERAAEAAAMSAAQRAARGAFEQSFAKQLELAAAKGFTDAAANQLANKAAEVTPQMIEHHRLLNFEILFRFGKLYQSVPSLAGPAAFCWQGLGSCIPT